MAVAVAALFLSGLAGRALVHDIVPAHPFIPVADAASAPAPAVSAPAASAPLPAGDPAAGKAIVAANCAFCHSLTSGGPTMVGPGLWGIAGRRIASVPGYDYSPALKAHAAGTWTPETLDAWLRDPRAFAAGTKMYYPGLSDPKGRADVIAFLRTLH